MGRIDLSRCGGGLSGNETRLHIAFHDPWRAACPSCGGRSVEPNLGRRGGVAAKKNADERDARCQSCAWRGDRVVDAKTGEEVPVFGSSRDHGRVE